MPSSVQVAKKAVTAAGYICRGEQSPEVLDLLVNFLLETANVKSDILPFAAGEALCFAFGGWPSSSDACQMPIEPVYRKLGTERSLQLPIDQGAVATVQTHRIRTNCAGVKVGPEQLLHTPVDSLAQAVAQDPDKSAADEMQVCACRHA